MKPFDLLVWFFGLASDVQAHTVEMPVVVHLAQHGWPFLALIASVAMLSPLLWRRR